MFRYLVVTSFFLSVALGAARAEDVVDRALQDCKDDHVCFVKLAGVQCADGTQSGFSVLYRPGARNLFVYLDGGGACWSKKTCESGNAKPLTHLTPYEGPYFDQNLEGWADLKLPGNPIGTDYHMVRIPYCTGDIHAGNQVTDYGTNGSPLVIRHVGYRNVTLILEEVRKRFPNPDQILLMGTSAGGLGATWNLHQLRAEYPTTRAYVINDGGLPFKTPFVSGQKLEEVFKAWGADKTAPAGSVRHAGDMATEVVNYNQEHYPDVAYGFISAYSDLVMTYFASQLNAPAFLTTVRRTMISLAENEFQAVNNYKVYYLNGTHHGYAMKDPATVVSLNKKLSDWTVEMLTGKGTWDNVRPDKP